MREGSPGVMRQCLQFAVTFPLLVKLMSFHEIFIQLKYTQLLICKYICLMVMYNRRQNKVPIAE